MIRARPVTFAGGLLLEDAPEEQKKKKRNFAEEGRGESEERERERGIPERDKEEKRSR